MVNVLPTDHRLSRVYRAGAGLVGGYLFVFGLLGLTRQLDYTGETGDHVLGLSNNGMLALLSVVVGVILLAGMVIGGNVASTLNIGFGGLFLLSGLVNMMLLRTEHNYLGFEMRNVIFSFLVGLALMFFGMYGRVSGGLPHDNPYYRHRHHLDESDARPALEQEKPEPQREREISRA